VHAMSDDFPVSFISLLHKTLSVVSVTCLLVPLCKIV
jgi:hypothetical protein